MKRRSIGKELKNFLEFTLKGRFYWLDFLGFAAYFISQLVQKKVFKKATIRYPDRALKVMNFKKSYCQVDFFKNQLDVPLGFTFDYKTSLFEHSANSSFSWEEFNKKSIIDDEIFCSIHRWYWLMYDNKIRSRTSTEMIVNLVKHWIKFYPYRPNSLEWDPYNASERISCFSNAVLLKTSFFELQNIVKNDNEISSFIEQSIFQLSQRLEYYPNGLSFNHVVNDLKGLITAAIVMENEELIRAASDLFFEELEFLVQKDGFIREGSSHYQLIITRWICEMEWFCLMSGRVELRLRFKEYAKKMLDKCLYYFVYDEHENRIIIPLIGDVSPDFDPEWMIEYFRIALRSSTVSKSENNYGSIILEKLNYIAIKERLASTEIEKYEIITRISFHSWIVFVRHQVPNADFFPTHAHDDYSSYIIFYKGKEVVVDPGRVHYMVNEQSLHYINSYSHNCNSVNDLSLQVTELNRHFFPAFYKMNLSNHQIIRSDNSICVHLTTNSLGRIVGNKIKNYERYINISETSIEVSDKIDGSGTVKLSSQIMFHPSVTIEKYKDGNALLRLSNSIVLEVLGVDKNWVLGSAFFSERYQKETELKKLWFSTLIQLPFKSNFQFKINQ